MIQLFSIFPSFRERLIRLSAFLIWLSILSYGTYQLYLTTSTDSINFKFIQRKLSYGSLISKKLFENRRPRDPLEHEWIFCIQLMTTHDFIFWTISYIFFPLKYYHRPHNMWSVWIRNEKVGIAFTIVFLVRIFQVWSTVLILAQIVIYYSILCLIRKKWILWTLCIFNLYLINNSDFIDTIIGVKCSPSSRYFFIIISTWNIARILTFYFDTWLMIHKPKQSNFQILLRLLHFTLYFPFIVFGPLITYDTFEQYINRQNIQSSMSRLIKKCCGLLLVYFLNEFILHTLYFHVISSEAQILNKINLWALFACVYWAGQFFHLKYRFLYGFSCTIAQFDGIEDLPRNPRCPGHVHRYSLIWREFDQGIYNFLLRYIYKPTLVYFKEKPQIKIYSEIQRLIASVLAFGFVYLWHGWTSTILIWTVFNFIGLSLERFGSVLKSKSRFFEKMNTDMYLEPFVTSPLAFFSLWNAGFFCVNSELPLISMYRMWNEGCLIWIYFAYVLFSINGISVRKIEHANKLKKF